MIARIWHGVTTAANANKYLDYLNETGVSECRATEGNLGVYVLRRIEGDTAHFLFISLWPSYDAIQSFAGPEIGKAKYYPEDKEFLLELEPTVTHYQASAFL